MQIDIGIILTALPQLKYVRIINRWFTEVIVYHIAEIIGAEVTIIRTEADVTLMTVAHVVSIVTLHLEAIILLLAIHITRDTTVF